MPPMTLQVQSKTSRSAESPTSSSRPASWSARTIVETYLCLKPGTGAFSERLLALSSSLFALITLPVEFNASARAQELLTRYGIIRGDEQITGVQKVLGAAAWTYVAAAVSAVGIWLFYVFLLLSRSITDRR